MLNIYNLMKGVCFTFLLCVFFFSSNAQSLSYNYPKSLNEHVLYSEDYSAGNSMTSSVGAAFPKAVFPKSRGFCGVINIGGTFAFAEDKTTSLIGFDVIAAYRLSHYASVGIGVGYYKESDNLHSNIPIFFELRNHFSKDRLSPYTAVNLGYAIKNSRTSIASTQQSGVTKGGPLVGINVGLRYLFTNTIGLNLFVGYVGHKETIEYHYVEVLNEPSSLREPNFLHQLKFGLGVNF